MNEFDPNRPCGDCSVCCNIYEIPELEKERGVLCKHHNGSGCELYFPTRFHRKPKRCVTYRCFWHRNLASLENLALRPDHFQLVCHIQSWMCNGFMQRTPIVTCLGSVISTDPKVGEFVRLIRSYEPNPGIVVLRSFRSDGEIVDELSFPEKRKLCGDMIAAFKKKFIETNPGPA